MPKPPGEYRVVVLGGSTVEHGDPALPQCLEEQLRKQGAENLRVYNFGVVSANSGNQLARLVFEVVDLKPDLVVFYDGVNDVQHPMVNDPRPGYSFDHVVYEKHPLISESASEYPVIPLMLYGSELMRRCCHEYFVTALTDRDKHRQAVGYRSQEWRRKIARIYVGNAIKARKVAEAHGSKFIWFYQPLVNYKEPRTEKEQNMVHHEEHFSEIRTFVRQEMASAIKRGDLSPATAVDLSDVFDGVEKQVFWNSTHIIQFARRIVVAGMEAPVLNLIRDDPDLKLKSPRKAEPQSLVIPPLAEPGIK